MKFDTFSRITIITLIAGWIWTTASTWSEFQQTKKDIASLQLDHETLTKMSVKMDYIATAIQRMERHRDTGTAMVPGEDDQNPSYLFNP